MSYNRIVLLCASIVWICGIALMIAKHTFDIKLPIPDNSELVLIAISGAILFMLRDEDPNYGDRQ